MAQSAENQITLLSEVAILYYQEHATQQEISQKFSLSRAKVGRLLRQAREQGIVEINVKYHPVYSANLEDKLKERFGLQRAIITLDQDSDEEQRINTGIAVSNYLSNILKDGMAVAVGQGRNISSIANHSGILPSRDCTFVAAIGGIHPRGGMLNADHICRQFAKSYNAKSETLYAPAYVKDKQLLNAFLENGTIKETLDFARKADVALVGVGSMSDRSFMVDLGWFSAQEVIESKINQGVIGDIAGYDFFDVDGNLLTTSMSGRIIGLDIEEYRKIPCVIAIASESSKSLALLGALRTKSIDILATSVSNATTLLNLTE